MTKIQSGSIQLTRTRSHPARHGSSQHNHQASQGQIQRGLAPHLLTGSKIGYRQRSQALPEYTFSKEAKQLSPGLSYKKSRFQPRLCDGCTSPVCFPCTGAAGASSQSRGHRRSRARPATKKSCRTKAPRHPIPPSQDTALGVGCNNPEGFLLKKREISRSSKEPPLQSHTEAHWVIPTPVLLASPS